MILPYQDGQAAPGMTVAMGKETTMYLLDHTNLGHVQAGDAGALQVRHLDAPFGVFGGPAYFKGSAGALVYYQLSNDVLRSFAVSTANPPALNDAKKGTVVGGFGGSLPIVSSNASHAGTGVVWVVHRDIALTLEAYDAERLGAPLFSAAAGSWTPIRPNAYVSALEGNGRVYVPGYKMVTVFGLTP